MEFATLVEARRSCRSFEAAEISEEQLAEILDAGQWAPSPLNLQPWEFITIRDPGIKAKVMEIAQAAKQDVIDNDGPGWVSKYPMNFLTEAPVLIVVVYEPAKKGLGDFFGQSHGAIQAASACIQNILLAAADMGFGSLWFTFFRSEKLKPVLNIPENLEIAGVIPIGTPKGEIKAPPRKEPVVHRERYAPTD